MSQSAKQLSQDVWARKQIEKFSARRPAYEKYACLLEEILQNCLQSICPFGIVQSRAKSIESFAEKVQRKRELYHDAVSDMPDLCGARVITQAAEQVKKVCSFIEQHFEISWSESQDVSQRLKPAEFGYRSVHYIVQFKEGIFFAKDVPVKIPKSLYGLKAEIQVRTLLEHSWADFAHDTIYKSQFSVPVKWQRESAALAATLEQADKQLTRILEGLGAYASSYGAYMSSERLNQEIEKFEFVLKYAQKKVPIANHLGKLYIAKADYDKAIVVLSRHVGSNFVPLLRNLGTALCRQHQRGTQQFRRGQAYLQSAADQGDIDSILMLACTLKEKGSTKKIHAFYQKAFATAPSNPSCFVNFLEYEIICQRNLSFINLMKPRLLEAVQRFRDQADVKMNLPGAFYDMGRLYLFLGKPYESLKAFSSAIFHSTAPDCKNILQEILHSLRMLEPVKTDLPGYDWVYRLLVLAMDKISPSDAVKKEIKKLARQRISADKPVVILAGFCNHSIRKKVDACRELLLNAFTDFEGTIVAGGTKLGVSGLAGDLQTKYGKAIQTVGYTPQGKKSLVDSRYQKIHLTTSEDFSAREPLQGWIDLAASGVQPSTVRLLGIQGGDISATEYRIALALGATVGLLKGSGGSSDEIMKDPDWQGASKLLLIPEDLMTLRVFLSPATPSMHDSKMRRSIAQAIHEVYRKEQINNLMKKQESMAAWNKLRPDFVDSNLQQADHIVEKLRLIDCEVVSVKDRPVALMTFTAEEIETLSEFEHGRWNIERLKDGWRYGPVKNVEKKISPYLIPWKDISMEVKEYDRTTVKKIPSYLAGFGLEIRRKS